MNFQSIPSPGDRSIFLLITLILLLSSCSSPSKNENSKQTHDLETIVILGTNDLHGAILPSTLNTREEAGKTQSIQYQAGGIAVLSSFIQILRSEFQEHLIWLDAGDQFQGSVESNLEEGAPMVQFFNAAGLQAAAIGNHEFDFGLLTLKKRMKEAKYPYLASNIKDTETNQLISFQNTTPSLLLQAGRLKIGILGLSTLDTPKTTQVENVKTLQFEDLKQATLRESQALRRLGAHLILITSHVGLACESGRSNPSTRLLRKPTDPQGRCGEQDEMVELLQSLPLGTVDGVIAGHSHQVVHHWVAGVPVIQGGAFGRYFNLIYLTYDWSQNKLLPELSRIEGPIPVCTHIFQNQNDCNGDRLAPKNGRGPLIQAKFHGKPIEPDSKTLLLVEKPIQKAQALKKKQIGVALRPVENVRMGESELGNLLADAIRTLTHADFAYVNSGGVRSPLEAGPITYGDVFRAFPFDNSIVTLQVNEKELRTILKVSHSGARGFGSISGLQLQLIDPSFDAPFEDLNGDGKFEIWKKNRLLDVRLSQGSKLDPNQLYTLATLDFLTTGGDDLAWPISQIPADRIRVSTGLMARDALIQYIEQQKEINTTEHPLLDPKHPRLKFEKIKKHRHLKFKYRGKRS